MGAHHARYQLWNRPGRCPVPATADQARRETPAPAVLRQLPGALSARGGGRRGCVAAAAATILIGASAAPASARAGLVGHAEPEPPGADRPAVLGVLPHRALVHGGRHLRQGLRHRGQPGRAVEWHLLAHPAHPQPLRDSGQWPVRRRLQFILGLHGSRGQHHHRGRARAVAERWNGTRWTIQPTPNPRPGGAFLNGVSCTSASACTAVGSLPPGTLAERWNGTRWAIQPTPNPAQGGGGLSGVSCTSASACTAVGGSNAGALAERWNGTSWLSRPPPTPPRAAVSWPAWRARRRRPAPPSAPPTPGPSPKGGTAPAGASSPPPALPGPSSPS